MRAGHHIPGVVCYHTLLGLASLLLFCACNGSNQAEVARLVEQNTQLREHVRKLEITVSAQDNKIAQLEQAVGSFQQLGDRRIGELYHVSSIEITSLSGGSNFDDEPGDDGVTLYVKLYDQNGHVFKAAGTLAINLYDLSDPDKPNLISHAEYDLEQTKELWFGRLLTYHYRIQCRWQDQNRPKGKRLLAIVTFLDYLSGTALQTQQEIEIDRAMIE